jgi:hypothetical protein
MVATTTRRTPLWFSLAFIMLAFSIFSWGLGYKLSLYTATPSSFHRVPSAKLLSGDEQNISDQTILSGDLRGLPPVEVEFAILLLLPFAAFAATVAGVKQWELSAAESLRDRRRSALDSFSFRPPPQIQA